jgi:hypothetical protein
MARTVVTAVHVQALRARAQRLDSTRGAASAQAVVSHMVALQAQDLAAATLGIGVRADGLRVTDVDRARNVERSIVRTWCLRGTLHLVAANDVHWLLELVRPGLAATNRTRRRELGLSDDDTVRGVARLRRFLANGPRTRAEIAADLAAHGVAARGQATIHVIWRAAIDGQVCCGPDQAGDGESTFVLLEDWAPVGFAPSDPVDALARRYRAAYGPATVEDFAAWSGLGRGLIGRAWTDAARDDDASPPRVVGQSVPGRASGGEPASPVDRRVRLLPAFDAVWLAYRDHAALLAPEFQKRVFPGGGVLRPIVFKDGHAVGTWTRRRRTTRRGVDVGVDLFERVPQAELEAAVAELGRFLGTPASLSDVRA